MKPYRTILRNLDATIERALKAKDADIKRHDSDTRFIATLDPDLISKLTMIAHKFKVPKALMLTESSYNQLLSFAESLELELTAVLDRFIQAQATDLKVASHDIIHDVETNNWLTEGETVDLGNGYSYVYAPEGNGYTAKFSAPKDMVENKILLFKSDIGELKRHAEQTKQAHQNSKSYTKQRWDSNKGEVMDIQFHDAPRLDEPGSEMYEIKYADGSVIRTYGRDFDKRKRADANSIDPVYQAKIKEESERAERVRQKQQEIREHTERVIEKLTLDINAWLGTTTFPSIQKGRIRKILLERINYSGRINGVLARSEFVQQAVQVLGLPVTSEEVNKYKYPNRQRWHRMDNYEQEEFLKKYNSGETKTLYYIGGYEVTKYEYLYANYLEGLPTLKPS